MAIPSVITDLSTNTASNSPLGTDLVGSPATVDDFFRSAFKITRDESLLKSWEIRGNATTYVSATTFTMPADQTGFFVAGRRIKAAGASTIYGVLVSSSFNGSVTTATILPDSGSLDASLSNVQLGIDPLSASVLLTGVYYSKSGGELLGNMSLSNRDIAQFKNMYAFVEYDHGNSGAAKTISWSVGQNGKVTLTANTTLFIKNAPGVGHYQLRLIQDATGARTSVISNVGAGAWLNSPAQPAFNTAAAGETILTFFWTGTAWIAGMQKVGTS